MVDQDDLSEGLDEITSQEHTDGDGRVHMQDQETDLTSAVEVVPPLTVRADAGIVAQSETGSSREVAESPAHMNVEGDLTISAKAGGVAAHEIGNVVIGDSNIVYQGFDGDARRELELEEARQIFRKSLKNRDEFVGSFLKQALEQANMTFRFSMAFMTAGGLIVLLAGALALLNGLGSVGQSVALLSGLAGIVVGSSGAAFSVKSDRARKHLAQQAERMHSQLLDERRFNEVAELLSGVKDAEMNDRARIALAMRLMGSDIEETRKATE